MYSLVSQSGSVIHFVPATTGAERPPETEPSNLLRCKTGLVRSTVRSLERSEPNSILLSTYLLYVRYYQVLR